MSEAFSDEGREELARCKGRWPHLRKFDEDACEGRQRAILLGASNSWFPIMLSVLSIPSTADKLGQLVELNWAELEECESAREVKLKRKLLKGLAVYDEDQIWEAVVKRKEASGQEEDGLPDLREPEWRVFSDPDPSLNGRDFKLRVVEPPSGVPEGLEEGRPRRAAAGGPCADRVHPDRVARRLHRDRRASPGTAGAAGPEGPEVGAHVRDAGRGGLPPVLGGGPSRRG